MRLFIAFPVDSITKGFIFSKTKHLRNIWKGSWVHPDNYHVTIQFLGETDPDMISVIDRNLNQIKNTVNAFQVNFKTVSLFPNVNRPKALVVTTVFNLTMNDIADSIQKKMKEIELIPDSPFTPHLTIARFKIKQDYHDLVTEPINIDLNENISKFSLIESILRKDGAIYKEIKSYTLKEGK